VQETPSFEVVVVDNDAAGSAELCVKNRSSNKFPIRYFIEPIKNIARGRNRAIREARADLVAFIDDDEVADSSWLATLYEVLETNVADAAFGPVKHKFAAQPPHWIEALNFFDYPVTETGTELPRHLLRTGNVLLRKNSFSRLTHAFDEDLGLSGGEDTDLFCRLRAAGGKLISAEEAVVWETVPESRMTFGWLARRHFRWGVGKMSTSRRNHEPMLSRVGYLLEAVVSLAFRLVLCVAWIPLNRSRLARSCLKAIYWSGVCIGFLGYRYYEYK
jgi:GT2 family glycosyltransferase